jgi:hypothetical protein
VGDRLLGASPWLKGKAAAFLKRRLARPQYVLSEHGDGVFFNKGTDFPSKIYRTRNGEFFRTVKKITPEIRERIGVE